MASIVRLARTTEEFMSSLKRAFFPLLIAISAFGCSSSTQPVVLARADMPPPPPPGPLGRHPRAESAPVVHEGVVATVLVNPHGDVDGLVLGDGFIVRMPPTARSAQLAAGAKVHAEGDGTSKMLHAR